jgi:hypothetical protein
MFRKRGRAEHECNNGILNRGLKEYLCLGSKRSFSKTSKRTLGLEIMKQAVESSVRLRNLSD